MTQSLPRRFTRTFALALLVPAVAGAQDSRDAQPAIAPGTNAVTADQSVVARLTSDRAANADAGRRADAAGPQASQLGVALRAQTHATAPAPVPLPRGDSRQHRALMIVGVAALVTGAVIGGDAGTIVMLGGAGIGLYGLYQFLN